MTLASWLISLSDELLVDWANKGLLRRAKKVLESQHCDQWLIEDNVASGTVEGFAVHIKKSGFDAIQCSCSASTTCYHMLVFLLGVQQQLSSLKLEKTANHATPSWLVQEKPCYFSKATWGNAALWYAQNIDLNCKDSPSGLQCEVGVDQSFRVSISALGNLAQSVCNCQQDKCVHLAYVVYSESVRAGCLASTGKLDVLSKYQREVISNTETWTSDLLLKGMVGLSSLQLASGQALATELLQADLPRLGQLMKTLIRTLQDEVNKQWSSSANRVRLPLTELTGLLLALKQTPLPFPLFELIGQHRKRYLLKRKLKLTTLFSHIWQTPSGYKGFSYYFWAPEEKRCYTYTEARDASLQNTWQPEKARHQAYLGNTSLAQCDGALELSRGWCTEDGRISNRKGTTVSVYAQPVQSNLVQVDHSTCIIDALSLMDGFKVQIKINPFRCVEPREAALRVTRLQPLSFDRFTQLWRGEGLVHLSENDNLTFEVVLQAEGAAAMARFYKNSIDKAEALFGRWIFENRTLRCFPLALVINGRFQPLSEGVLDAP